MSLHESGEMYLETILLLSKEKTVVRSIDVAEAMSFSKPSVSRAMSILRDGGFITIADDGSILLTKEGSEVAQKTLERHEVLTTLFTSLGVNPDIAENDACKVEHVISDETFEALKEITKK